MVVNFVKSADYWRKRFELLEEQSNKYGLDTFRQVEASFLEAEKQIQKEIEAWYGRYAKNNNVSITEAKRQLSTKELKEFRWDVDEYIKHGRENAIDPKWMKELENASARVHVNRLEALKIRTQQAAEAAFGNELDAIDAMARKVYTEDYYHSIFEMHKGFGVGWNVGQVDERKLGQLISKPWAADGKNFSKRIWGYRDQLVNELHKQMTRNCALGKHSKELIDFLAKKFKTTKGQAGRLVMTEQAFFHSAAQRDAFKELDVEEFEIVATLDSHTSETCQDLDGKHFPMSEYEINVTAPPFHQWCRSVTAPYFEDNFGGERAARGADGKTYYVPDDMKYKDWKEHFVDKTKNPEDWLKRVDPADVKRFDAAFVDTALEWYVSGEGQWVNQYLRNPDEWKADYDITDEELELIEAMKQGTNSEIVQESVLYRSVDASAVFGKMSQAEFENLRDFVVYNDKSKYALQAKAKFLDGIEGKEIVEKGFLSTSKDMDFALEFGDFTGSDKAITLELKVPKGIKGKDLKKFELEDDPQFEVLLAPNQKYVIKEVTTKQGQIYVKADLIAEDIVDVKPAFIPATNINDAIEETFKFAVSVDLTGAKNLKSVNELNEALTVLTEKYPIPRLETIATFTRGTVNARANWYLIEIKRKFLNDPKTGWTDYVELKKIYERNVAYYENLLKTNADTPSAKRNIELKLFKEKEKLKYHRWTVSDSYEHGVKNVITHEYGHVLADAYCGQINGQRAWKDSGKLMYSIARDKQKLINDTFKKAVKNGDIYNISAYGSTNSHEFFAEAFAMLECGENLPDYIISMFKEVLEL